ncbi:MAG: AraC family transcriptional regulator [bacterium]
MTHLPGFGTVEAITGYEVQTPAAPELREEYSIRLIERGHGRFTLRRGSTLSDTTRPRRLLIVEPGELLSSRPLSDEGWTFRRLNVPLTLWRTIDTDASTMVPHFHEPRIVNPGLVDAFRLAHVSLSRGATALTQTTLLAALLGALHTRPAPNVRAPMRREHAAVKRMAQYLRDHLTDTITLADVAHHVGLSPFYALATFRAATGLPIHQYHIQMRVVHARGMLARGETQTRAAMESGFADQSHLGRHFKRIVGVTPGAYAAAWTTSQSRY